METIRYRNRFTADRIVEAVQLSKGNGREVFEWAPGKQFFGPDHTYPGLTIFTPDGRAAAIWGDYVYRDEGTDRFWTAGPDAFVDSYEQMPEVAR